MLTVAYLTTFLIKIGKTLLAGWFSGINLVYNRMLWRTRPLEKHVGLLFLIKTCFDVFGNIFFSEHLMISKLQFNYVQHLYFTLITIKCHLNALFTK